MDVRIEGCAPPARKPRILFVAESISLAHVVRLAVLAGALDRARYEVWFASARFPPLVFAGTDFIRRTIESPSLERTLARASRAHRPWDDALLARNVQDDLRLLDDVRPDLVVGDFRVSLAVSAPVSGTPYASLINAYWSPYAVRGRFPIPGHPLVRLFGEKRVARRYGFALPFVFQHFARPLNRVRKRYGLPAVGDLLDMLTFGDYTLYPDIPELVSARGLPATHRYLGTIPWSPDVALPPFWQQLDPALPLVYATLGSSGDVGALDAVIAAARALPITLVVSTAGRRAACRFARNVWITDYVPGDLVARRASVVITNGGSTSGYQALEQGTPVLGLPSNFDQYLAADTIARAGAGLYVSSSDATPISIVDAVARLLSEEHFRSAAASLKRSLAAWDCRERFREFVDASTRPSGSSVRPRGGGPRPEQRSGPAAITSSSSLLRAPSPRR